MDKIGATGGNTGGAMGSFTAPRIGGFSGNKKQPTTNIFQNRFFSSQKPEDKVKGKDKEKGPANKIVKFGAGVKAKDPGNGSLIQSISTNINNQFGDAVTQLQSNVTNIVSPVLDRLKAEHRRSTDDAETNKPTNLLGGFLSMLRSGLDFIKFLSDRKRLGLLRKGIKNLKTGFNELFQVGETVAKTLKKIIKQLKKLAKEGGGGGRGLRLPGGIPNLGGGRGRNRVRPQRRPTTPRPRRRRGMGTAGLLMGGASLLGGGMALAPAVQGSPTSPPPVPEPIVEQPLSQKLLEKFNKVLDQFNGAIDSLTKPAKTEPTQTTPPTGSGGGSKTDSASMGGGGPMPSEDQDLYTTATLASMEGGTDQSRADVAQAVYNRMGQRGMSATEVATESGQFAVMFDGNDNIDADAKNIRTLEDAVKFRMKKKGETAEVAEGQIRSTIGAMRNQGLIKNAQTFVQDRTSFRASAKNYQTLSNSIFRGGAGDNQFLNEETSGVGTVAVPEFVTGVEVDPNQVKVDPAPQQSEALKKAGQGVSQPARQGGGVSVVPVGGGSQQSPGGGGSRGPANKREQGGIPFMSSSMNDNAHDMFSRMTYNVVG